MASQTARISGTMGISRPFAIWDAMRPSYQSVMNGELEPAAAAAAMQARAVETIEVMHE